MTEFVPHGYISVREAVNRLGLELFPKVWTGKEHEARRGLISEAEWLKIKDLPGARGGGATGGTPAPWTISATAATAPHRSSTPAPKTISATGATAPHWTGDPSNSSYQAEYSARERYEVVCHRLRAKLEAGELEAAVLDPFKGKLHQAPTAMWRRHDADRMIEKGQAPIPYSPNTGRLVVREFPAASRPRTPLPGTKIQAVVGALLAKLETESLTRPQQKDFVRESFPDYRVTDRQFDEIFQKVPVPTGRPKKSNNKV